MKFLFYTYTHSNTYVLSQDMGFLTVGHSLKIKTNHFPLDPRLLTSKVLLMLITPQVVMLSFSNLCQSDLPIPSKTSYNSSSMTLKCSPRSSPSQMHFLPLNLNTGRMGM